MIIRGGIKHLVATNLFKNSNTENEKVYKAISGFVFEHLNRKAKKELIKKSNRKYGNLKRWKVQYLNKKYKIYKRIYFKK